MTKFISWENWNEIEKMSESEFYGMSQPEDIEVEEIEDEDDDFEEDNEDGSLLADLFMESVPMPSPYQVAVHTPFGHVPASSRFKPTDRWQCWIGHANFKITKGMKSKIKEVDGVSIVKVLDGNSFCIGIGKLFDNAEVKQKIQNEICN